MTDNPSFEINTQARHIRSVFLIDEGYNGEKLLELFFRNQVQWGGRLNPIVPVQQGCLVAEEWFELLSYYDPDYIFHSAQIDAEFILKLCDQFKWRPVEISNLENTTTRINGLFAGYLVPIADRFFYEKHHFLKSEQLWKVENPLKDYYKLNFLIDDHFVVPPNLLEQHQHTKITPENFHELNRKIVETNSFNLALLSRINVKTRILQAETYHFTSFELIIAKDKVSMNDMLYYWNKQLYAQRDKLISAYFMTIEQMELLLKDPDFAYVLQYLPIESSLISLVSFSVSRDEMEEILKKFKDFTKTKAFQIAEPFEFPFKIRDGNNWYPWDFKEKQSTQIIPNSNHLINLPSLSFQPDLKTNIGKWAIDIQISKIGNTKAVKKFPLNTEITRITGVTDSRVNKGRELTIMQNTFASQLQINIPAFHNTMTQVITDPKPVVLDRYNDRDRRRIYSHCSYNDASGRLNQFISLFRNDFDFIEEFTYDKFWSDLFHDLTNNVRVEGDTITFQHIIERFISVFTSNGGEIGSPEETPYSEKNLRVGIRATLQNLMENKIFLPGFVIKCKFCASSIWYSLAETNERIICKGCSNLNHFRAELPIAYKLNHLIKNNISLRDAKGAIVPDGDLTAIKTLLYLHNHSSSGFEYLPQLEIYRDYRDTKPVTDLDIIAIADGKLYIGEAKHSSPLFFADRNKSLNNLIELAATIKPDVIILACTEDSSDRLDKAAKFIRHTTSRWNWEIEVRAYKTREPNYFDIQGHKYFRW